MTIVTYPPGELTEAKTDKILAEFTRCCRTFDNNEAKHAYLGDTEDAAAARDSASVQALYDKCLAGASPKTYGYLLA